MIIIIQNVNKRDSFGKTTDKRVLSFYFLLFTIENAKKVKQKTMTKISTMKMPKKVVMVNDKLDFNDKTDSNKKKKKIYCCILLTIT